jgi:hypothetical protein
LKSKKKLFVFFGFRGFRSECGADGVSANFTTSALRKNYATASSERIGATIRHADVIVPGYPLQTR